MADVKISGLPASTTPLAGTEVLPVVQGGVTKQVSVNNLTAGKAVSAASLALTTPLPATSGGTGLSNLGTGVATWLGTPSSANLAAAVTDETGTGPLVFATNPIFRNTAGAAAAGFTNSAFQDVLVNYYMSNDGNKIALQFASNGGSTLTNAITSYGSAYGGSPSLNNVIEMGNSSGKVRVTTTGDILSTTGNFVVGTSGKGIDFSATPGTGTSELLNDYEEGDFTPTVIGTTTAGTATYGRQTGRYTKVGRLVTFSIDLDWSGGTGTGNLRFSGLPFTSGAVNTGIGNSFSTFAMTANNIHSPWLPSGAAVINANQTPTGGGAISSVPYAASGSTMLFGSYIV
jgi:hypothetical protein